MRSRSPTPCTESSLGVVRPLSLQQPGDDEALNHPHQHHHHYQQQQQQGSPSLPTKNRWASSHAQVVLLSLVCFCCPGMYNAVLSMGGGVEDQSVLADSIVALHICFAASSMASPTLCNSWGPRVTLFLGTLGYTLYIASLAAYQHLELGGGAVVAGGALNGISAGMLWTAQGRFLSLFWGIFNLGAVFGGVLTAVANWQVEAAAASLATYVAFMALMALGSALSLLLASPTTVQRPDGTYVQEAKAEGTGGTVRPGQPGMQRLRSEVRAICKTLAVPLVSWLLPLTLYSNWFYTYQFSCFNHELFTVRSQGVNNSVYWCAQMYGAWALGRFLDNAISQPSDGGTEDGGTTQLPSLRRRAVRSLVATSGLVVCTWAVSLPVTQGSLKGGSPIDIVHSGWIYAPLLALYMLWGVGDSLVMVWLMWVLGQDTNDMSTLARYSGIIKAVQASGSVLSWKLNTSQVAVGCRGQFWVNVLLACMGLGAASRAVRHLRGSAGPKHRADSVGHAEDALELEQHTLL